MQKSHELRNSSVCSTSKEFLDNASKSSSGYDDEEFNDDNTLGDESSTNTCDESVIKVNSFIIISDSDEEEEENNDSEDNGDFDYSDGEDSDAWTVCSAFEEDFYGFLDGDEIFSNPQQDTER